MNILRTQILVSRYHPLIKEISLDKQLIPGLVQEKYKMSPYHLQFSSVAQSCPTLSHPMNHSSQASLSITNSQRSLRLTSIQSVMPSSHLILCRPLLLLPPIPPSIRVFSNESTLHMRWPKYWSFSFSIIPSKEIPGRKF